MSYSPRQLERLESESKRLCRRYIDEMVLRFSLCPWAEPSIRNGKVQIHVVTRHFTPIYDFREAAQTVFDIMRGERDSANELLLIVLPRAEISRLEMDGLLREIRNLQAPPQHASGETSAAEAPFALAAFHPDAEIESSTPERLIPYLRRSPDPLVQAVRLSVMEKIDPDRGSGTSFFDIESMSVESLCTPPPEALRLRVARANLETCQHAGFEKVEKVLQNIQRDRIESRKVIQELGAP